MICGYIIDKILGVRLAVIIFNVLMFTGQLIFAFGAYHNHILVYCYINLIQDDSLLFLKKIGNANRAYYFWVNI